MPDQEEQELGGMNSGNMMMTGPSISKVLMHLMMVRTGGWAALQ